MDLRLDIKSVKKSLYKKCEVLTDIPVILQCLEKGEFVDSLKDCLQNLCDKEHNFLKKELQETMCPKQNNNIY